MVGPRTGLSRFGLAWALLFAAEVAHAAAIDKEKAAEVKAVYLKHIAALTTWPETQADEREVGKPAPPIVIGVLGRDSNGVISVLRPRIESPDGLLAQKRQLKLVDLNLSFGSSDKDSIPEALNVCDLVFLSEDGSEDWDRIRPLVEDRPIVTVSEFDGFARDGGMIEYSINRRKGIVLMIVNMDAVKRAGLTLSAIFLKLKSVIILREEEAVR